MPGSRWISLAPALVAAGVIAAGAAGCHSNSSEGGGQSGGQSRQKPDPPEPLLDGWDRPAAAIVLSGEQDGFLEPCGCTELQSGGMGRRHALFKKLQEMGWPLTAFDLGGTVRHARLQSQLKFQTILASFQSLGYSAMALGQQELRFGADYLLTRENLINAAAPVFVAANLELYQSPDLSPARYRVIAVGDVRIGVTAVLGISQVDGLFPEGANTDVKVTDPAESLSGVLPALKADAPDLLVLLSHASLEESRDLAARFPEFDVVATTGGPEDPDGKPERLGDTLVFKVGHKGKAVGVLGFYPQAEGDTRLRFELVKLDNQRFTETAEMRQFMQSYQDELRERAFDIFLKLPRGTHPRGATFVGAAKCGECHTKAYNKWKTTRHAHATESLIVGREGEKHPISRIHDPECLACHVTGWHPQEVSRYVSGYLSQALVEDATHRSALEQGFAAAGRPETLGPDLFHKLQGQQCENCHRPGSEHVQLEEAAKRSLASVNADELRAGRQAMFLSRNHARDHVCGTCHDLDNSPNFKFDEYWEKVRHPWRD